MLFYVCVTVPIRVGLDVSIGGWWYVLDLTVDLYFYIDIILNLVTGYRTLDGTICMDWYVLRFMTCTNRGRTSLLFNVWFAPTQAPWSRAALKLDCDLLICKRATRVRFWRGMFHDFNVY